MRQGVLINYMRLCIWCCYSFFFLFFLNYFHMLKCSLCEVVQTVTPLIEGTQAQVVEVVVLVVMVSLQATINQTQGTYTLHLLRVVKPLCLTREGVSHLDSTHNHNNLRHLTPYTLPGIHFLFYYVFIYFY